METMEKAIVNSAVQVGLGMTVKEDLKLVGK